VCDGENQRFCGGTLVDQGVREPTCRQSADAVRALLAYLRIHIEQGKEALDLLQEILAEAARCGFVEGGGVGEFGVGEWVELRRHPAKRRRALAKAVAAGTLATVPALNSSARRCASSNQTGSRSGCASRLSISTRAKCARSSVGSRRSCASKASRDMGILDEWVPAVYPNPSLIATVVLAAAPSDRHVRWTAERPLDPMRPVLDRLDPLLQSPGALARSAVSDSPPSART